MVTRDKDNKTRTTSRSWPSIINIQACTSHRVLTLILKHFTWRRMNCRCSLIAQWQWVFVIGKTLLLVERNKRFQMVCVGGWDHKSQSVPRFYAVWELRTQLKRPFDIFLIEPANIYSMGILRCKMHRMRLWYVRLSFAQSMLV